MRSSRILSSACVLLLLSQGPLAAAGAGAKKPAAAAAKPAAATSAKQLLDNANKAVAGLYKTAKASGGKLDPKNKKQAPFWQAVGEMKTVLAAAGRQVQAKDKKLASTLSKGTEALAKMKTVWPRLGVSNPQASSYLTKLDNAYSALRSARGAEGARARKAGPLSAEEKAQLGKVKSSQADFAKKLTGLRDQAKAKKDAGTVANLERLIEKSNRIAQAQLAVDAFLLAMVLLDQLQGEWQAYSYYVGPEYRASWVEIDVWVDTTFVTYDTWYVESFEVYSADTWTTWETSFEITEDFEYEITDVSVADVTSFETEFEASFEYEELSWESYSETTVTAEMEETVFEEMEDNLDVSAEVWEEEGLEVEAGEELMDAEDQEEFEDEEATADEEEEEAADEEEMDEDAEDDEAAEEEEGDEDAADEEEGEEDEADEDAADEEEDSEEEDAGDEEGDEGDEGDEGADEGADEGDEEPPATPAV